MYDNFVGFQDGIVDFLGIDFGVFEDTFQRGFDRFEIIGRFFFDGHFYILPKYFYLLEIYGIDIIQSNFFFKFFFENYIAVFV